MPSTTLIASDTRPLLHKCVSYHLRRIYCPLGEGGTPEDVKDIQPRASGGDHSTELTVPERRCATMPSAVGRSRRLGATSMFIDIIDNFEDLERLKPNWDAVYEADPEAQFFLSWTWLSQWLLAARPQWFVLAVKPTPDASSYVAFFPL